MSINFTTARAHVLSFVGALFFTGLMVGVATPVIPVA